MIRLSIPEYGRIARRQLDPRLWKRLHRFDQKYARRSGETVFDWNRIDTIRARNYVGVVQLSGLAIEILPKVDSKPEAAETPYQKGSTQQLRAQHNLLYMLSVSRNLPIRDRDIANQRIQRLSLLEYLIRLFAQRLQMELRRGIERAYVSREDNLPYVKGKLLLHRQIQLNATRHDRSYVTFDEFIDDTWLNRILKATTLVLLRTTQSSRTAQLLREILLELANVKDHPIEPHHFEQVHLDRSSERFRALLDFCRVVLANHSPTASFGEDATFSMLFPMEQLFEEFIGHFLKKYSTDFGLESRAIHLQASHRRLWLLTTAEGTGRFRLKPDVVVDGTNNVPSTILDTKWKRLLSDEEDTKNGVKQSDIYQLFGYAQRYRCQNNVLLFPQMEGVTPKTYLTFSEGEPRRLRVAYVNLNRDLRNERKAFAVELKTAVFD